MKWMRFIAKILSNKNKEIERLEKLLAFRLKEIERLENLLADADLCAVCGLDYAGYADYEDACKCDEVSE